MAELGFRRLLGGGDVAGGLDKLPKLSLVTSVASVQKPSRRTPMGRLLIGACELGGATHGEFAAGHPPPLPTGEGLGDGHSPGTTVPPHPLPGGMGLKTSPGEPIQGDGVTTLPTDAAEGQRRKPRTPQRRPKFASMMTRSAESVTAS